MSENNWAVLQHSDYRPDNKLGRDHIRSFAGITEEVLGVLKVVFPHCFLYGYGTYDKDALPIDDNLRIAIWKAPQEPHFMGHTPRGSVLYGIPIYDFNCVKPSNVGVPLYDPAGYRIAEWLPERNHLYVFVPLVNPKAGENGRKIFQKLLEQFLTEIFGDSGIFPDLITDLLLKPGNNPDQTHSFILEETQKKVDKAQATLAAKQSELESARQGAKVANNILHTKTAELDKTLFSGENDPTEEARTMLQELQSLPYVSRVVITPDLAVEVYTRTILAYDDEEKRWHELGDFKIILNSKWGTPRWFNLNNKRGYGTSHQAPHVSDEGTACLGNTAESFRYLLSAGEYVSAAMLAIQFVRQVNRGDQYGDKIRYWPVASPELVAAHLAE